MLSGAVQPILLFDIRFRTFCHLSVAVNIILANKRNRITRTKKRIDNIIHIVYYVLNRWYYCGPNGHLTYYRFIIIHKWPFRTFNGGNFRCIEYRIDIKCKHASGNSSRQSSLPLYYNKLVVTSVLPGTSECIAWRVLWKRKGHYLRFNRFL